MSTLLTNAAVDMAFAALIGNGALIFAAIANWFNAKARAIDVDRQLAAAHAQLADLQRQQMLLATAQQVSAAQPAPGPTIITLPASPAAPPPPVAPTPGGSGG